MRKSSSVFTRIFRLTTNHRRYMLLVVLLIAAAVAATAFVSGRLGANAKGNERPAENNDGPREYVRKGRLHPRLRENLTALGDRLEKRGKERATLAGTISRQVGSQMVTTPIRLMTEYPNRLRIEIQHGNQIHTSGSDGHNAWKHGASVGREDRDLIESLLFDSADHFFVGQAMGFGVRQVGVRLRTDNGTDPNYSGPYFDVYQVNDQVGVGQDKRSQSKLYYFNSDTLLLDHIAYDSGTVKVEVRFANYQRINGQQMATTVTRLENDSAVLTLNVASVGFDRWHRDNTFDAAANR